MVLLAYVLCSWLYTNDLLQIVGKILCKLPNQDGHAWIEDHPEYLLEALNEALTLVGPVKGYTDYRER